MSVNTLDLHWASGFLEAEGSFHFSKQKHLHVAASQVQTEPLKRLKRIFGGNIYNHQKARTPNHRDTLQWMAVGSRAAGVCMTLYSLMSEKRKGQIKEALEGWKSTGIKPQHWTHCKHGHEFTEASIYMWRGKRNCRICRNLNAQRARNLRRSNVSSN